MDQSARDAYLEAQIMTATPQKLRLMLIEAALRFARVAHEAQTAERHDEVFDATVRCRQLITELIASVDPERSPLTKQVVALYVYLFRTLTEAQLRRDPAKFADVVKVLEIERETWRQVCEKMPLAPTEDEPVAPKEITSSGAAILPNLALGQAGLGQSPARSFSLDS